MQQIQFNKFNFCYFSDTNRDNDDQRKAKKPVKKIRQRKGKVSYIYVQTDDDKLISFEYFCRKTLKTMIRTKTS